MSPVWTCMGLYHVLNRCRVHSQRISHRVPFATLSAGQIQMHHQVMKGNLALEYAELCREEPDCTLHCRVHSPSCLQRPHHRNVSGMFDHTLFFIGLPHLAWLWGAAFLLYLQIVDDSLSRLAHLMDEAIFKCIISCCSVCTLQYPLGWNSLREL